MGLDRLRVFLRVAQAGSFVKAARDLGLDRTRVSRIVAALEHDLGVRLLVRTTRRVAMTAEGQELVRRTAAPLAELERAVSAVPDRAAVPAGEVTVTATMDVGRTLLAPLLPGFRARFPAVTLRLQLTDEVVTVGGDIDLALRVGKPGARGVVARRLRNLDAGFYAAPAYLAARGTPTAPRELAGHDGLWPVTRGRHPFSPAAAPPRPTIACGDFATLAELASAGAGIALLPTLVATRPVARGELVRVLPELTLGGAPLYLVSAPLAVLPPRVRALRDALVTGLAA